MRVMASTQRGLGIEIVTAVEKVTADKLRFDRYRKNRIDIGGRAEIDIDEVRTIVKFLRSKGVKLDETDDKQRHVGFIDLSRESRAQVLGEIIVWALKKEWLNEKGIAVAKRVLARTAADEETPPTKMHVPEAAVQQVNGANLRPGWMRFISPGQPASVEHGPSVQVPPVQLMGSR
jgi:hypothetical protein